MKNLLLIFAISLCSLAKAQYDTTISISSFGKYSRIAAPGAMVIDRDSKMISLSIHIIPIDSVGNAVNNPLIHPYVITISTEGICVLATGQEVPCSTENSFPQWYFLRKLSLMAVSEYAEEIQYIRLADSNGAFN